MKNYIHGLFAKRLNEKGQEIPDPTPIAPPVGFKRQPSLSEQIRAMIRSEQLRQEAESAGYETFEEADDFDIPDDPIDPTTPYEAVFDPQPEFDPSPGQNPAQVEPPAPSQPPAENAQVNPPQE